MAARHNDRAMPTLVRSQIPLALHDSAATRRIEQAAANALPAHPLMQRAGLATARLALALAPHARRVWIAAGGDAVCGNKCDGTKG